VGKGRLEAFSDGVFAIIITNMVLELRAPHEASLAALGPMLPVFCGYTASFVFVEIYWNNHHHMLHAARHVDGGVLWANMGLLFCLSMMPLVTSWIGEHPDAAAPVALYGVVCFANGVAWLILQHTLVKLHGKDSTFAGALGSDVKGKISALAYASGVALAFVNHWVAMAIYVAVSAMWLVPDRRFARAAKAQGE
jgi:uncharacterized membrane protein